MTPQDFHDSFAADFREELADIAGPPQSSADLILELTWNVGDLVVRLEAALADAAYQRNRADELEKGNVS